MISLAGGLPDPASFPQRELAQIAAEVMLDPATLQYGVSQGAEATRVALASLFADAMPEDILVTTGSQQALDLVTRVVVNPGDQVVVGDPDYLGALQIFRSHGAELRSVPIDKHGLNTERLEHELQWGLRPKLVYLVPNFHNPTGSSMSDDRRRHLAQLAERYGFLIIEDDPYRELYCDSPPSHVQEFPPELTVQLRSTSKTLAPGLRIGAAAAPAWLLQPLIMAKQATDLHTSTLSQAIVAWALAADWYCDHLDAARSIYREKRDAIVESLRSEFADAVDFTLPSGGMFIWARFANVADTSTWLTRALDRGVCFVPGQAFSVQRDLARYARLSYATGSPAQLQEGVARLASIC